MPKNKDKLWRALLLSAKDEIKISHKDIAIEKGVTTRAIRKMKKENIATYKLFEDALKFRKMTQDMDIRFITEFNDEDNIYWLYADGKKMIGFDDAWLRTSKLDDRELKNLRTKDIGETTIRNEEFKKELIDTYCGEIVIL